MFPVSLTFNFENNRVHKDVVEQAKEMMKLHKLIQENIQKANAKYKLKADKGNHLKQQLEEGDFCVDIPKKSKISPLKEK